MRSSRKGNCRLFLFFLSCDIAEGWLTQDSRELLMSKASETSRAHWSSWLNSAEVFEKPAVQPHVAQWDARWAGESFCKGRASSRCLVLTHQAVCPIYLFIYSFYLACALSKWRGAGAAANIMKGKKGNAADISTWRTVCTEYTASEIQAKIKVMKKAFKGTG